MYNRWYDTYSETEILMFDYWEVFLNAAREFDACDLNWSFEKFSIKELLLHLLDFEDDRMYDDDFNFIFVDTDHERFDNLITSVEELFMNTFQGIERFYYIDDRIRGIVKANGNKNIFTNKFILFLLSKMERPDVDENIESRFIL